MSEFTSPGLSVNLVFREQTQQTIFLWNALVKLGEQTNRYVGESWMAWATGAPIGNILVNKPVAKESHYS